MSILRCACIDYLESGNLAPMRRAIVGASGPLADAARGMLKLGKHSGPCVYNGPDGACSVHLSTFKARRAQLLRLAR
jgi:hypothetical protein